MSELNTIVVSTLDMDRISQLMDNLATLSPELEKLEEELDRATVLEPEEMPENVVTMNSTVRFKFSGSDEVMEKTLVYPNDVKSSADVSIFALWVVRYLALQWVNNWLGLCRAAR